MIDRVSFKVDGHELMSIDHARELPVKDEAVSIATAKFVVASRSWEYSRAGTVGVVIELKALPIVTPQGEVYRREVGSFTGGGYYTVTCTIIDGDEVWACTCPDFRYRNGGLRGECKHISAEKFSRWTMLHDSRGGG
jgi:hypothetical protein